MLNMDNRQVPATPCRNQFGYFWFGIRIIPVTSTRIITTFLHINNQQGCIIHIHPDLLHLTKYTI